MGEEGSISNNKESQPQSVDSVPQENSHVQVNELEKADPPNGVSQSLQEPKEQVTPPLVQSKCLTLIVLSYGPCITLLLALSVVFWFQRKNTQGL